MKILLLGKNGQLGWELQRTLAPLGPAAALDFEELNLEDFDAVRKTIRELRPQVIVNASAYTAVDRAESEPEKAYTINGKIPGIIAEECAALNAALVHYSTDYVFDGTKGAPYKEEDTPNPLSVYGRSKLAGEQAVQAVGGAYLILRTSWVYALRTSAGSLRGDNFVAKVLSWARQQETLRVVSDQIGNPTWARMLAEVTALVCAKANNDISGWMTERRGVYHLAGSGYASRLDWARLILELDPKRGEQVAQEILPSLTSDYPVPAQRPLFSALNCDLFSSTFHINLPGWEEALRLAMAA
ncbi:MAG: dTDP-4-dehydrorhamnose reductase [Chloroflexi bacterium]|nr:dTDP-4-dehydrorhamnose reductase [Chloroflexota bacterium]